MSRLSLRLLLPPVLGGLLAAGLLPGQARAAGLYSVHQQTVEDYKAVFATVEASETEQARARIGGTVTRLMVDEGDEVTSGQVLAVIGDSKLGMKQQSVQAGIDSLKAQLAEANNELARMEQLFKQGVVSKARRDQARTAVEVLDRSVRAQGAERSVIEQQSAEGAVKAPGNGRVLEVTATLGAVIMPGESIATIARGDYILKVEVPERHARFIRKGDPVLVGPRGLEEQGLAAPAEATTPGATLPDTSPAEATSPDAAASGNTDARTAPVAPHPVPARQGKVIKVYPKLQQGRVIADVEVDTLGNYFVGERTLVWISTGSRPAFLVPRSALTVYQGLTFVTLADGRRVVVQTGTPSADPARAGQVEVLSGLREGDQLQLADQAGLAGQAETAQ